MDIYEIYQSDSNKSFYSRKHMDLEEQVQVCQLPRRPRGGYAASKFRNIEISTNFFPVSSKPIDEIHIFRLKFIPQIALDDRTTRNKVLQFAINDIRLKIRDPVISGMNIYSIHPPTEKQFIILTGQHQISIKQVKCMSVKENPKLLVQFLNNGLRNLMSKLNYVEIGRTGKYFNAKKKQKIDNLVMFSGYKVNFMQLEKGIYLRVDTAKKIVRNQTVLQYINEIYKLHNDKERDEKRSILKQELINKIVMTNYGKTRYVKITDIEFSDVDTTMIPEEGCSIREYYTKKYNIKIQNPKQPLLVIQERKKKVLKQLIQEQKTLMVPQICLMTGIPDDFDQFRRKKISEATIRSAEDRRQDINSLMREIKGTNEINSLNQMGIKLDSNMETFSAKMIPAPRIRLGGDEKIQNGKQSFFNLFSQPIFAGKHSLKVGIIYFRSSDVREMVRLFQDTSRRLKIQFKGVSICAGDFDSRRAINAIDDCVYKAAQKEDCNICLILIPNQLKGQYKKIKQKCLLTNKIICQIATEGTLRKKNFKSIATKILLQMIAKRGNTLWVPESAMKIEKVMMAAFDTAKMGNKNVISGVATINSTYSSICSRIQEYNDTNDKLHCMMTILLKLIDAYIKRNKEPPKQIIVFSNSCPADLMNLYQDFLISPLVAKMEQIYNAARPAISFVLVNTKTNERFFQMQGNQARNVPAGTIVSENIVSKNYDFFIISQFATRGSTVPNHYRVIYSDSKIEEGPLQELIYSQCFNYVNWTGSIKVPGILQYAKKCVRFSTQILETRKISEQLESKLYFI